MARKPASSFPAALTKKTTGSQITLSLPLVLKTTALSSAGIRWQSKNQSEIVTLAFQSTSDFPYILADSANKTLRVIEIAQYAA